VPCPRVRQGRSAPALARGRETSDNGTMTSKHPPKAPANDPPGDAARDKIEHPHAHFENPAEVVVDSALMKDDKVRALETLEQDARQMADAASEGMDGGERAKLDDVLSAKKALDLPPFDRAVTVVVQGLRARLPKAEGTDARASIARAIDALEAAHAAIKATTTD